MVWPELEFQSLDRELTLNWIDLPLTIAEDTLEFPLSIEDAPCGIHDEGSVYWSAPSPALSGELARILERRPASPVDRQIESLRTTTWNDDGWRIGPASAEQVDEALALRRRLSAAGVEPYRAILSADSNIGFFIGDAHRHAELELCEQEWVLELERDQEEWEFYTFAPADEAALVAKIQGFLRG